MRQQPTRHMLLNLPLDVRAWIEAEASRNLASMNSTIVVALRKAMDAEAREKADA